MTTQNLPSPQTTTLEMQGAHFVSVFPEPIDSVLGENGEVIIDNAGKFDTKYNIWGLGEHDLVVAEQIGLQPYGNNVSMLGVEYAYHRDAATNAVTLVNGNQAPFVKQTGEINFASNFLNGFDPLTGAPDLYLSGNIRVTSHDQEIRIEGIGNDDYFFIDAYHRLDPSLDITIAGFENGVVTNSSGITMDFVDNYVHELNIENQGVVFDVFPEFL